jgi:hypothetical protein
VDAVDMVRCLAGQLWRLLVVASVDPRLGAEKGTDGGELVKVESRQLDGIAGMNAEALGCVCGSGDRNEDPLAAQRQSWAMSTVVEGMRRVSRSARMVQAVQVVQSLMSVLTAAVMAAV